MKIFAEWRAEFQAEAADVEVELAAAIAAHDLAVIAVREARQTRNVLVAAIAKVGPQNLAGALALRARAVDLPLSAAEGALTRAKNAVTSARRRQEDLRLALHQIDVIDDPPPASIEEPVAELEDAN